MNGSQELERSHSTSGSEVERFAERMNMVLEGKSLRSFAHGAGVSETVLRKYQAGESTPNVERLVSIASAADVSISWLAAGIGPMRPHDLADGRGRYNVVLSDEFALVPQYDVVAAAGAGSVVDREDEIGKLAFRRNWLRQRGLQPEACAVITISGDSMVPTIRDGALVLVDTQQTQPGDDGVYVIQVDDHLVAKRLQHDFRGGLYIRSDNPAYGVQQLAADEAAQLCIVGRVIWAGGEI